VRGFPGSSSKSKLAKNIRQKCSLFRAVKKWNEFKKNKHVEGGGDGVGEV
jgi:hypothetical protein